LGTLFSTGHFGIGTIVAVLLVIGVVYLLVRPYNESKTLKMAAAKN
jgi:ferrous iron transport protein B